VNSWISSAVLYQVNPRSLAAREPRNAIEAATEKPATASPLAYMTNHLTTLRELGVNLLYLMPPYPIGETDRKGIGSPYAIRDFRAIAPELGTLEEFKELVRHAHGCKMRVILDITPNHTSRDHVWVQEHPEYYVKDDKGNLYYDCDWTDTAKLDYHQPALRRAMVETCDFWLSCLGRNGEMQPDGVDGFRLDMAHFINDLSFWDEAVSELKILHEDRELLFLAECYGRSNNLGLFARGINAAYDDDFFKVCQYLYAVDSAGHTRIVPVPEEEVVEELRDAFHAFREGGIAGAMERVLFEHDQALPSGERGAWLARYTENHDEGRGVYRFGPGAVRAVNRLVFCLPRTIPFLLTGQEFGAVNRPSIHSRVGICDKGRRVVDADGVHRDPGLEWEGNLFARGAEARKAWYTFYRDLIKLRFDVVELREGAFRLLDIGEDAPRHERTIVGFERVLDNSTVRCAVNLGPEKRKLSHADKFTGEILYGALENGALPPFEAVVVRV